jgi:hypothetical protein
MKNTVQWTRGHFIGAKNSMLWVFLALLLAVTLAGQEDTSSSTVQQEEWGTSASPNAKEVQPDTALEEISASNSFSDPSGYGTGGVALRNRKTGNIGINGVIQPVRAAFMYWAAITEGPAPAADKSIQVQRLFPAPASGVTTLAGTLLGTGASPCWPGNTISVFRAPIPLGVATGNGSYQVTILPGAGGSTNGADPWVSAVLPLFEGASIVLVGSGSGTVAIYDSGLAGHTFFGNPGLTYTLNLPSPAPGTQTLFDNIGADGQHGTSRTAVAGYSNEATTINSVRIAGPGSPYVDSDWNGSSGFPLPQLWDDTGHDITAATPRGTTSLNVAIRNSGTAYDCLTTVANVVETR